MIVGRTFWIAAVVMSLTSGLWAGEVTEGEKLFALKVKPLFAEKCHACHGDDPDKIKGDFNMLTRGALLKGGDSFAEEVVILGKGEESFLYLVTTRKEKDFEMPPKEADRLTEEEQGWIRDWIDHGAPWPDDKRIALIEEKYAEGEVVATSQALSADWQNRRYETTQLWAYRPLNAPDVPAGKNPIDWFIDKKLAEAGLEAAPDAEARHLIRRMSFNVTGLPPTPDRVKSFASAYAKHPGDAVKALADELMATPQYGEQFARHWLDVVRYADSAGFANDYTRPNAWRYRDYVVRAFNDDKPYNQFIREQIAGDEIDPADSEMLIATGFLRMGPWEQTGMSVFKETRQLWLDDVTDSVGQTFLAHAMQCAKCHDHKFDPVPTRDYYRMMAVFSTTQFSEREAPFLEEENRTGFAQSEEWVKAKIAGYQDQHARLLAKVKAQKTQESGEAKVGNNGLDPGDEASMSRLSKNLSRHKWELDRTRPIAFSVYTGNTIPVKSVSKRILLPNQPWGKGTMEQDRILAGGSAYSPTDPVTPGALSAAQSLGRMETHDFPAGRGSRRLALAEWISDRENPLTARVMVNRVWAWNFGKGIAGNPNNFGGTGAVPTHPELLDYLARWFMDNGWSVKKLNQLIASSELYRRSSRHPHPSQVRERDAKGRLYATLMPRRLTAEELRDAILWSSGELNLQVGGIPARPDINTEVALQPRQIMGGTASVYEPDTKPEHRNRRSLYAEKVRGLRDPFLETFNQPGPDKSCELRETSTVAPQSLTLFNTEEMQERSVAFAARLLAAGLNDLKTIDKAFELALGRMPSSSERSTCLKHWQAATQEEQGKIYKPKEFINWTERTVMAEKTGEPYSFIEFMPAFRNYEPDTQMADVDARTRGLSQVCLVLFNLNEFSYLD